MELLIVYLWLKLGIIIEAVMGLAVIVAVGTGAYVVANLLMIFEHPQETIVKRAIIGIAVAGFITFTGKMIPTQKDTAILVGTYYAVKALESPEAAKVQTLLRQKANQMLDDAIAEGEKKGKKE